MRLRLLFPALALALLGCNGTPSAGTAASAIAYHEGAATAPIHFIYFDDQVCEDCRTFSMAGAEALRTKWIASGKLELTVIDLAWHRGSVAGSAATVCAAEQQKFWEMHELLFTRQDQWKREPDIPTALTGYARELGLDTAVFRACSGRKDHQRRLDAAEDSARLNGVRGTPAFIVNGKKYFGSQDWPWMDSVLVAYAAGHPEQAPPPPIAVPKKKVVDSLRLKELQDSAAKARGR